MEAAVEPLPQVAPMDASNAPQLAVAEPMTDAEAEAVLRVLGTRLTWEQTSDRQWDSQDVGDGHMVTYYIGKIPFRHNPALCFFVAGFCSEDFDEERVGRRCPTQLFTANAAKLACERHHATGKWE